MKMTAEDIVKEVGTIGVPFQMCRSGLVRSTDGRHDCPVEAVCRHRGYRKGSDVDISYPLTGARDKLLDGGVFGGAWTAGKILGMTDDDIDAVAAAADFAVLHHQRVVEHAKLRAKLLQSLGISERRGPFAGNK